MDQTITQPPTVVKPRMPQYNGEKLTGRDRLLDAVRTSDFCTCRMGWDAPRIIRYVHRQSGLHHTPPLTVPELEDLLTMGCDGVCERCEKEDRCYEALLGEIMNTPTEERGEEMESKTCTDRPLIMVKARPTEFITKDILDTLVAENDPPRLFVRGGELVTVRSDENDRPYIETVHENVLRHIIARVAYCVEGAEDKRRHVHPPMAIVRDVLATPNLPFPALQGITEAPVLRPDGTILDQVGYDRLTRLKYLPAEELGAVRILANPTQANANTAATLIAETIGDFPFSDQASRANAEAGLLTPIVRQYVRGNVPLLLIDSPTAGTGKTLLASTLAIIATGRPAALMSAPKDDEEFRKRITSILSQGSTLINIDNVDRRIDHPSLAAALTASTWEDRRLGTNDMVTLPQRATWVATGNNLRLGGDLPRRCYLVRVDAKVSRPWERTGFRHPDLEAWVMEHRGELLGALLTMARAWVVAGKPAAEVPTMGGFTEWSSTVGGILHFCGVDGFLGNLTGMYDRVDEESQQWEAFLLKLGELYAENPWTVSELTGLLTAGEGLADVLPDALVEAKEKSPGGFRRRVGKALAKRVDTRFGGSGVYVERLGVDSCSGAVRWRVKA